MKPNCRVIGIHSAKQHKLLDYTIRKRLNDFALELLLDNAVPGRRNELEKMIESDEHMQELVNDLINDMVIQGTWVMQDEMLDCIDEYREDIIEGLEASNV